MGGASYFNKKVVNICEISGKSVEIGRSPLGGESSLSRVVEVPICVEVSGARLQQLSGKSTPGRGKGTKNALFLEKRL